MPAELKAQTKLEHHIKYSPVPRELRLWGEMIVYSIIILIVVSAYYFATNASFSERILNRAVGDVALLLIGFSLVLSSICYFWDFADKYIIYRKHLGLVGSGYMTIHIVFSILFSAYSPFPGYYLEDKRIASFIGALIATAIFVLLAAISNRFAIHEIGATRWRKLMRLGYIGFVFVLFHFGAKGIQYWTPWLTGKSESIFPSFSLIVFMFGVGVVILRIALWFSTSQKSKLGN
ncbi:hypothetical protein CO051_00940 [Candidatus Roizmanbacteria bacterium CG_4_9_14_0_2_um_filter_39_13]|uniref:Ferric oxidoreductase domain-containing protein n=1 Tax=Candidatus Roizmanbacteria bacterium CG_4_9_14_0_2_um_filter_39_13 TaxID=1974839 RepID=A0A2M8F3J5_9BACT|nr:MAG: hypothetical protein COY15_05225 [Candidatus Roizmanbacteria bacterium CG_4_10_14_0_2_um_filter_39_12]PJC33852.1 MAG: hypothetical protein CO051_00940 [Candidatus Roizmanbacteria bacterium CG_4_9_14_0_2_um_filter_39_13]